VKPITLRDDIHGNLTPRVYQVKACADAISKLNEHRSTLVVSPTGCHRKGQRLLMWSGRSRVVEHIEVGDVLMGPDGTPRLVCHLCRGRGQMVEIRPTKGEPWVVNIDHVLTLVRTSDGKYAKGGEVVDVTVREWLGWSKTKRHMHKLFRATPSFEMQGVSRRRTTRQTRGLTRTCWE
jgi:hypothetical protein